MGLDPLGPMRPTARFALPVPAPRLPVAVLVALLLVALAVAGCTGDEAPQVATTVRQTETTEPPGPNRGGTLRIGSQSVNNLDPHFSTSISDIMLNHQIYDWLVEIDSENQPVPGLATSWESNEDGTVWTFSLRPDVTFHDGSDFTAEDVVYTFNRLRDPQVGTPVVPLYDTIRVIEAPDPLTVRFVLSEPSPEFPSIAGDYHAAVLSSDVGDPATNQVGTGPFKLEAYAPEDRAVLSAFDGYWRTGEDGAPLPYVDRLEFRFSPNLAEHVEALRGGDLDFVGGLTAELASIVEEQEDLSVLEVTSNMHYVIHMRSDTGPTADNRVRRALKLATDHQALIDAVRPGLAVAGNGYSPIGPSYGDYYYDQPPQRDVEAARSLLADAGYADGLEIRLVAQQALDVPAIAEVWKQQMAEVGVEVTVDAVPSDIYYGEGEQSWLEVPFGITEWGTRATPVNYFQLAYIPGAPYNESHWENQQMAELTRQIAREIDRDVRIDLYHQAQQLMIDEGPIIVAYFESGVAGAGGRLRGVELATDWPRTSFAGAYLAP